MCPWLTEEDYSVQQDNILLEFMTFSQGKIDYNDKYNNNNNKDIIFTIPIVYI